MKKKISEFFLKTVLCACRHVGNEVNSIENSRFLKMAASKHQHMC